MSRPAVAGRYRDLHLTIGSTGEVITVSDYFRDDGASAYTLNAIEFADGTSWDVDTVKAKVLQGTDGNDNMTGFATDDVMNGGDGNDTIRGQNGDDTLNGGDGRDALYGGDGMTPSMAVMGLTDSMAIMATTPCAGVLAATPLTVVPAVIPMSLVPVSVRTPSTTTILRQTVLMWLSLMMSLLRIYGSAAVAITCKSPSQAPTTR